MNKGCFWYLKVGFKNSYEILIKNPGNYFKYFAFMIAYIISSSFIFPYPIFALAHLKINEMVSLKEDISLTKAFEGIDESKRYSKYLFVFTIFLCLIIGIIGIVALFSFLFLLFVSCIPHAKTIQIGTYIILLLTALLLIAIFIYASLRYIPISYIISEEPQDSVSNVLKKSFEVTNGRMGTLFLIGFFVYLILAGISLITTGFCFLLKYLQQQEAVVASGIMIVAGLVVLLLIILFLVLPYLNLTVQVASYLCIRDGIHHENDHSMKENEVEADEILDKLFNEKEEPHA